MLFLGFSGLFFFSPPTPSSMLCSLIQDNCTRDFFCNSHHHNTPHPRKASFLETSATMSRRSRARLRKKNPTPQGGILDMGDPQEKLSPSATNCKKKRKSGATRRQNTKFSGAARRKKHLIFPALRAAKKTPVFPGAARRKKYQISPALRAASNT